MKLFILPQLLFQRWGSADHPAEWDGRDGGGGHGSQRFWEYLWTLQQIGIPESVLDVGSGKPMFFPKLLIAGGVMTYAIDPEIDGRTLEDFVDGSANKSFDWITCISVLEHIEDKRAFCSALDSFHAPIALTCEIGKGCIEMPELYQCLAQFKRHHVTKMEACPVVADNSDGGKWRPLGIVLRSNQ